MLSDFQDAIIERLHAKNIPALAWSGKPDELFMKVRSYPSVRIIIESADFEEMHSYVYGVSLKFSLLVFFRSLKDRGEGAYEIIENIVSALAGFESIGFDIRLKKIDLLSHESGEFCYQIQFVGYGRYVALVDEEQNVKRITTFLGEELSTIAEEEV